MPKETFFNLSEAKHKAFLAEAVAEFAERDPAQASISQMVARAGIAKGSFYQYFTDKQDLHLYLVDLAGQERLTLMGNLTPPDQAMDFFAFVRWGMAANEQFHYANPAVGQVIRRAMLSDYPWREEARARLRATVSRVWLDLVRHGAARGDIDPSYDPEIIVLPGRLRDGPGLRPPGCDRPHVALQAGAQPRAPGPLRARHVHGGA